MTQEQRQQALWDQAPALDRETAIAAISRSSAGPYADNEAKKARYRTYLEHYATNSQPLPHKPTGMKDDDFVRELNEFYNCARIFKPMTGFMASRFTTAKTSSALPTDGSSRSDLLTKPEPKLTDPAEEAAKVGMYGKMTRFVEDFFPTRLLCKRFNVKAPAHVQPDNEPEQSVRGAETHTRHDGSKDFGSPMPATTSEALQLRAIEAGPQKGAETEPAKEEAMVNPERNDALEGTKAHDEVLRAIFGDSDSE